MNHRTTPPPPRKRRLLLWTGLVAGVVLLFYFFPLLHVVPLKAARQRSGSAAFDADAFVEAFWNDRLLASTDLAVDASELLDAFRKDAEEAVNRFGRRLGLSSASCYFVSGTGKIVEVKNSSVAIVLREENKTADVLIETGLVFGNAVRDGSRLLDVSDFPNSQDFNAVSSEINRRVEERVLPLLKQKAALGASVRFVGCTEIVDPETDVPPLRIVPIVIEIP